jgi:hypothetical protein
MADTKDDTSTSGGFKVTDRRGAEREETPAPAAEVKPPGLPIPRPPIDFTTFILSLASTALVQLGVAPNPETGESKAEPELAREMVDLLGMLREKTRGNLTDEESKFFDAVLYDLRVRFVELSSSKRS